jgi:hypothetical protein
MLQITVLYSNYIIIICNATRLVRVEKAKRACNLDIGVNMLFLCIGCVLLSASNSRAEVATRIFRIFEHMHTTMKHRYDDTDTGYGDTGYGNSKNSNMAIK